MHPQASMMTNKRAAVSSIKDEKAMHDDLTFNTIPPYKKSRHHI
jgi:hypothetical protein